MELRGGDSVEEAQRNILRKGTEGMGLGVENLGRDN